MPMAASSHGGGVNPISLLGNDTIDRVLVQRYILELGQRIVEVDKTVGNLGGAHAALDLKFTQTSQDLQTTVSLTDSRLTELQTAASLTNSKISELQSAAKGFEVLTNEAKAGIYDVSEQVKNVRSLIAVHESLIGQQMTEI